MTDSYYYYRCPCPSTDCNGSMCRYNDMMAPSSFNPSSCTFFPQDRKLLSYNPNTAKIPQMNKHIPQATRWAPPYPSIRQDRPATIKTELNTVTKLYTNSDRVNSPAQNTPTTTSATTTSTNASTTSGKTNRPRRIRTAFTPFQLLCLETSFDKNHYVVGSERKQLASYLKLSETQVKVWFQNRRTKWKRQSLEGRVDLNKDPLTP